jgi:chromatin segregation and condensation protein Rec8/ScpA/Scc1 (kleisin family)
MQPNKNGKIELAKEQFFSAIIINIHQKNHR